MAKLIFENNNHEENLPDGSDISDACEQQGIPFACGDGICGACVIEVVEGKENLNTPTEAERDFLGDSENERLACQCKIEKGTIKIKY